MTHRLDVAVGRDLVVRWCALTEQRLQYLTELFESGRWRRYYSERAFLENIREAKRAVEAWRALLGHPSARKAEASLVEGSSGEVLPVVSAPWIEEPVVETDFVATEEAPSAPIVDLIALERALIDARPPPLDLTAIEQRYPLLRNAL